MAEDDELDPELSAAVDEAVEPARHDAVMAVWQQVVLGRLEHPGTSPDVDELHRRLREEEQPPDDPP